MFLSPIYVSIIKVKTVAKAKNRNQKSACDVIIIL